MELISERRTADPAPSSLNPTPNTASTPPIPTPQPIDPLALQRAWRSGLLGALQGAALILSARLILLLAVLVAGLLAWRSLAGTVPQLAVLGLYTGTVVLPLVFLAGRK